MPEVPGIRVGTSGSGSTGAREGAHSPLMLGHDADDRPRVVYPPGSKVSDLAADLHLLAEKDSPT